MERYQAFQSLNDHAVIEPTIQLSTGLPERIHTHGQMGSQANSDQNL